MALPPIETLDSFLDGDEQARGLVAAVFDVVDRLGEVEARVGKSQVAFGHRRVFASVWRPRRYLAGTAAPLVVTVYLPFRDPSPRWKEVVEPTDGHFTHHLELRDRSDVDDELAGALRRAWDAAA